jgi:hypothetical protein
MTTSTVLKKLSMVTAGAAVVALAGVGEAQAATMAPTLTPSFSSFYSLTDLGSVPQVSPAYGGLTFKPGDPNTLLIGASAATPDAAIYSVKVERDSDNTITGFGEVSFLAKAPGRLGEGGLDAGLTYSPNGDVLFYTAYPDNSIGQIKSGSSSPDKQIDLNKLGVPESAGSVAFVPEGFAGAGRLKFTSYTANLFYDTTITPDGSGTYDIAQPSKSVKLEGGLDGFVYVKGRNPGFSTDSILIQEYDTYKVAAYGIDENGDPIASTRQDFITGLGNPLPTTSASMGATTDPKTGNVLFSAFFENISSGVSKIFQVKRADSCTW